jgi:hypothetical protein
LRGPKTSLGSICFSIACGKHGNCTAGIHIQCASAAELPFADQSFELGLQSTVFTWILDAGLRRALPLRVLRVV